MTQHPMGAPSLFDDGKIGTGIPISSQLQSKVQTINLIDLMHDGFYIVFPVSYTHLTLPTICSV